MGLRNVPGRGSPLKTPVYLGGKAEKTDTIADSTELPRKMGLTSSEELP